MKFILGVIEGFYGRPWSWEMRHDSLNFWRGQGFNTYIYAPKNDVFLRRRWREGHPAAEERALREHREAAHRAGLDWGLGLSLPDLRGAEDDFRDLRWRLASFKSLAPDVVCLLFDDLPTPEDGGRRQAELCCEALRQLPQTTRLLCCPTYYSYDPILEELFGRHPAGYFAELAAGLPPECGVFWTGEQVVAREYRSAHLQEIAALLGRKPVLWDNYLSNDGLQSCKHLRLLPFRDRPATLRDDCAGHLANPMNQGLLSRLPLATLGALYRQGRDYEPEQAWAEALDLHCAASLITLLQRDAPLFLDEGLDSIPPARRRELRTEYESCATRPALEVAAWLAGEYPADPGLAPTDSAG